MNYLDDFSWKDPLPIAVYFLLGDIGFIEFDKIYSPINGKDFSYNFHAIAQ